VRRNGPVKTLAMTLEEIRFHHAGLDSNEQVSDLMAFRPRITATIEEGLQTDGKNSLFAGKNRRFGNVATFISSTPSFVHGVSLAVDGGIIKIHLITPFKL
jgi:hypothetical protein